MATGGRVVHHLAHQVADPRNCVVLTGYQAEGTRGRQLLDGERHLKMYGRYVPVRAEVVQVPDFSVHADADELVAWVASAEQPPRTVYVVHGEADGRRGARPSTRGGARALRDRAARRGARPSRLRSRLRSRSQVTWLRLRDHGDGPGGPLEDGGRHRGVQDPARRRPCVACPTTRRSTVGAALTSTWSTSPRASSRWTSTSGIGLGEAGDRLGQQQLHVGRVLDRSPTTQPAATISQKQCMTVSGTPRSEAWRKAKSITGSDAADPSAPTSTPWVRARRVGDGTRRSGHAASWATATLTDPSSRPRKDPRPREPRTSRWAVREASTNA